MMNFNDNEYLDYMPSLDEMGDYPPILDDFAEDEIYDAYPVDPYKYLILDLEYGY